MKALYLWGEKYKVLSDIDIYFSKIFYRTEYNSQNIEEFIDFINKNGIHYVCIQNPYLNEKRLFIYNELKKKNIGLLISDRGALPNSWFFDTNGFNADSTSYNSMYWDKELSPSREKKVIEYIHNEITTDASLEKQGGKIGPESLRNKLKIDKDKKILFVPLQRPSDTVIKYFSKNVKDMNDFLQKILEIQEALKKDWVVLVKKHPLEIQHLHEENLRYVDDDTHFKDLLEICDAVVLINSGIGLNAMMYQKPVYHFGEAFYSYPAINKEVKSSQDVVKYLENNSFQVDFEKTKRFISYLIEDFYSFGELVTEIIVKDDGSKNPAVRNIYFKQINGLPKKSKKQTLIITHATFWKSSIGGGTYRIQKLIMSLYNKIDLKVLFIGKYKDGDLKSICQLGMEHIVESINDVEVTQEEIKNTKNTSAAGLEKYYNQEFKAKFNKYLENTNFEYILVEYIHLDYLVNDLHKQYYTLIDTIDIMSLRAQAYANKKDTEGLSIVFNNIEEELKILSNYHYRIAIQKNEFKILEESTYKNKNLLVTHPTDIKNMYSSKENIRNINFISGPANYKHIIWFIENIWGYFSKYKNLTLNIYGSVCAPNYLDKYRNIENVILHGIVDDITHVYKEADVCINPVRYGSGLKIKNVEALGYGIPLITTDEGASGIEDGIDYAFLLANTVDEWIEAIISIKTSKELREQLSTNAVKYAEWYFSDDVCFSELTHILQQ